jgi:uncharacterized repeat protein (TIGR01451 family)
LLATGGVTSPSAAQTYGVLVRGGAPVARPFTFTAAPDSAGFITATLHLQDGASDLGTVSFVLPLPVTAGFSNAAAISIPDHGIAVPYPSTIVVSGLTGLVGKATATLHGLTHSFPRDVNALLVAPNGGRTLLVSHAGGAYAVSNATITLDDSAAASLPENSLLGGGSFKPTAYAPAVSLPSPAPSTPYGSTLEALAGHDPNGSWALYVFDDSVGDAGLIARGWSLQVTTINPLNSLADLAAGMTSSPASIWLGGTVTNLISVTNLGPSAATAVVVTNTLGAGVVFVSASGSQGGLLQSGPNSVTFSLGGLAVGEDAQVVIVTQPSLGGTIPNLASVAAFETDLNPANNSAATSTTVMVPTPARLTGLIVTNHFLVTVTAEPGLTYVIQSATNLLSASWLPLTTNVASGGGTIKFVDPTPLGKTRFYRAVRVTP